jgi:hypothetical protein
MRSGLETAAAAAAAAAENALFSRAFRYNGNIRTRRIVLACLKALGYIDMPSYPKQRIETT